MTDSQEPEGQNDPSAAPEYTQLGEDGNPFSNESAGVDEVPAAHGGSEAHAQDDAAAQNDPLPDGGPTDGSHGVDDQ